MHPLTALTGIMLGSSFSIMFSLGGVLAVFMIIGDEQPRLSDEVGPLFRSLLIFTVLTAISAVSFYTLLKRHPARWPAQVAMWGGLAATGAYFWP